MAAYCRNCGAALVVPLLVLALAALSFGSTSAAAGPQCSYYIFQDEAQAVLDTYGYAETLDPDGDGVACNELPARPDFLQDAITVVLSAVKPGPIIKAYSNGTPYTITLAGLEAFDPAACAGKRTEQLLAEMLPSKTRFLIQVLGPSQGDDVLALAWLPGSGASSPTLLNVDVARAGLLKAAPGGSFDHADEIAAASRQAEQAGVGFWGTCEFDSLAPAPTPTPNGQILDWKGNGDQVSTLFTIPVDGTYQLTSNGSASLIFVDLYDQYGNWIPQFSLAANEGGIFSTGGFLQAGQYYARVQAIGVWWITITPLS